MAGLLLTALALCLFISAGESQVLTIHAEHSRINVTDGGNALFSVRPSAEVTSGNWAVDGKLVLQWINANVVYGSGYQSRAELFSSNGSLLLRSVNMSDSGEYIVNMISKSGSSASATVNLLVLEPVSKPVVTSNDTNPVEYNDTVSLTCTAKGTDVSYLWFMNNKTVSPGGRITLSSNNSTLTISGVLRSDEEFTCEACNLVNRNTSDPFLLNVRYGPENLTISISPDLAAYGTGSNVNFSCSAVSNPAPAFQWYFNGSSLQASGQRLNLIDLSVNDTGSYTCEAFNNVTKRSSSTTRNLEVLEPVSEPNITANATSLIEYNDSVKLICSATGTAVSYLWLEDNSTIIPGGRFVLGADKSTLTIPGVLRTDGPFTCIAYNSISEKTSEPFYLNVYYGPDRPNITTNPDSPPYTAGSSVTLTCSAESRPTANLDWSLNGDFLQTGQQLILDNISVSKTGNYTCQAFNNVTEKYSASTLEITLLEPVSNVTVTCNNLSPVENNDTVVLICDAQGTIQRRTWLKNNQPIQENDRIFTSSDKANLTITRVNKTDTGTYNCTVSNDYNSGSAAIYVQVNYGPDNVRIVPPGPVVVDIGSRLTLNCSAQSVPSGEYKWYNGTKNLQTGQEYTIETVSSVDSGSYTCKVYNNVNMKHSNRTVVVTAREKTATAPRGLSGGAIAGIVIGSVAGVCLVAAAVAWFVKTQGSRLKAGSDKGYPKMTSPSNIQPSQTEYAAVERKQPNQPKPEPSSNGANQAPPQAKDRDIIYTNPKIINAAAKPTSEVEVDKTDYATLKYQ
ncbi:carcinoembryonic antigen-related cell adhesion molecule 5-like [Pristis pectinata]|uniref:carcinoembryonic antigen-related cell adhesion molecule 5-like n=1 Tax=Pristis pectinata TaxID=685728 RepID=UPI00223DF40F|nr:carcinoembryonic antigen-related cell adhesion molecule 5-like [Pristis pectinata]